MCRQLRDDDAVYSGHRAHGHALAKGAPMDRVMAELMGRSAGLCQGLGGSMHLVDTEHGLMGATGVVGGNLPMAAGDALASRLRGSDRVTVVFFGDGAVQAGHFHETVNLASLWELPLIFVCENNGMAEFTPRSAHTKVASVADVVAPYDFERQIVEGADVGAVRTAFGAYLDPGAHRSRPVPAGVLDAPAQRPLRGRPAELPRRPRRRRVGQAGPDRPARGPGHRAGLDRRGGRPAPDRRGRRRGRPRRAVRPRQPAAHRRAGGRAGLRDMTETTYVKAINGALAQAMREDERVIVVGEDVAEGGPYLATEGLSAEFGRERVRNTPISEGAVCGIAVGAAQAGLRPVVEIMFIDFITLALDQLVNQAAKAHFMSGGQLSVPMVLRTQGGSGGRAGAQHSQSLEAWLTHIPGLKVVMPATAADAAGLLHSRHRRPQPGGVRREQVAVLPARVRARHA